MVYLGHLHSCEPKSSAHTTIPRCTIICRNHQSPVHKLHSGLFVGKVNMIPHHNSCGVCPRLGEDFGGNLQPIPQTISIPSRAGYFGGKSTVYTIIHRVHSRFSWEYAPTRSGIWQEFTTYSTNHVYHHLGGGYFCGGSMVCTMDHGVHSPVTMSTFCSQHQTFWLGIFLSFVLCILFLTATQCWCTI